MLVFELESQRRIREPTGALKRIGCW